MINNDFNYNRMMNEANRDLICYGIANVTHFFSHHIQFKDGNQYSTIAAVASIDNRKDSSLSMGTGMEN